MNFSHFIGKQYVRSCPSCHRKIGAVTCAIFICPHCEGLFRAQKATVFAGVATMLMAVILGVTLGIFLTPVMGVIAVMGSFLLYIPLKYIAATRYDASVINDPVKAAAAFKFCFLFTDDYDYEYRASIRAQVAKKVKSIFDASFPPGMQVEYHNYLYKVIGVSDDLTLAVESGRDHLNISADNIADVKVA